MNSACEPKKILVMDKDPFRVICSAILQMEGHETCAVNSMDELQSSNMENEYQLVVASYPFQDGFLEEVKGWKVPVLVLTDGITGELVEILQSLGSPRCLLKPLDFEKFLLIIGQMVTEPIFQSGRKMS